MKASYTATLRSMPATRNKRISPNRTTLPSTDERLASATEDSVDNIAMKPPSSSAVPNSQPSTTGSRQRRRCMKTTAKNPASVEAVVARRMGRKTSVGSGAPCCARYMKIETGKSVSDEAFSTRKRICALLARSGSGLSDCSSRIALRPIGVAALSRPSALAVKFIVISPSAGWPTGTSGMRRANSGDKQRASRATSPAFSAICRKPSQRVSVPNSRIMTSTDSFAIANRLSTIAAKTAGSPTISQRQSALALARKKKLSQRTLSIVALRSSGSAGHALCFFFNVCCRGRIPGRDLGQ